MNITEQVVRERKTETELRRMDAHEIVDWIHRLEDETAERDAEIERLQAENEMLRDGDTCARMCEGAAYRIEAQQSKREIERLKNHLAAVLNDMRYTDRMQSVPAMAAERYLAWSATRYI